ncbi:hypothetical protein KM295_10350 [Natronomonas sp. F2-12]|jgi:hypothetical protein|uniref:DUF7975 domain-containing protein n=1 Tax=Natronomonas aquatica TaxID=2841590 RepID=A0A9R1CTZ8_9EURY|nr:hypothetical protein [Natronomonas aquatica]MCQ4333875.1 hypothetical protein [Natronomonas aquatica]
MTDDSPGDRKRSFVRRILEARRTEEPVIFEARDAAIEYDDRSLRLELTAGERDRLEALLEAYHVFKIEQPATRKADDGVVYLSAVTDAKHAADFLEALFREVYGFEEHYELQT